MRLITRHDTSLAIALIAGAIVAFERPLRWLLDLTRDLEQQYRVDLLPALTLLVVALAFHHYSKRVQARAALAALGQEMAETRARTEELERLMAFGQALASATDRDALSQALGRHLPRLLGDRECTVLWRQPSGVEVLLRDVRMDQRHTPDSLQRLVRLAAAGAIGEAARHGVEGEHDVCFPLLTGPHAVGAIIIRNEPALTMRERAAIGAAGATLAVAARNTRLLQDARQTGIQDALTGCVVRAHAVEVLQHELHRSRRSREPLAVIMFDLDGFKGINDTWGHLKGDLVLQSVGAQLREVLRSSDTRCRYGGDEFLLILPDTPASGAAQVADQLRRAIAAAPRDEDGLRVTASIGVASALPGELDVESLMGRADAALYRAKREGRNRYCVSEVTEQAALMAVAAG
ncbi:MAG: GGDEF domain-containing protein [Vicinamibacterales bacterium]|nr:GGDEF domain-containing protein [Vicinamibacterales bacterium]